MNLARRVRCFLYGGHVWSETFAEYPGSFDGWAIVQECLDCGKHK